MFQRLAAALLATLCTLAPLHAQEQTQPPPSQAEQDATLKAVLDRYVGRWVGTLEIRNLSRAIRTIKIEQQYWWDDIDGVRVLRAQAVMAADGAMSMSESLTYIEKGRIYSQTHQDGHQHFFVARISKDGNSINWFPVKDAEDPLARKLTDTFAKDATGRILIVDSYEEIPLEDGENRALLTMHGELHEAGDASPLRMPTPN